MVPGHQGILKIQHGVLEHRSSVVRIALSAVDIDPAASVGRGICDVTAERSSGDGPGTAALQIQSAARSEGIVAGYRAACHGER